MADIRLYNMDCMDALRETPDGAYDLAIVDPPYGGGGSVSADDTFNGAICGRFGGRFEKYLRDPDRNDAVGRFEDYITNWDYAPPQEYFDELARVSHAQIIWGGNYFDLPPTRCFLVWRKTNIPLRGFTMSPVEYAWTSFNRHAALFEHTSIGTAKQPRFHPTQKPVELYEWQLANFAERGMKILDTHAGSASLGVACWRLGFDYTGYELNPIYYKLAQQRLDEEMRQATLF